MAATACARHIPWAPTAARRTLDPRSFLLIPAGSPVRPTHRGAIPKERKLAGERKELLMSWIQISGNFSSKREIDRRGRDAWSRGRDKIQFGFVLSPGLHRRHRILYKSGGDL